MHGLPQSGPHVDFSVHHGIDLIFVVVLEDRDLLCIRLHAAIMLLYLIRTKALDHSLGRIHLHSPLSDDLLLLGVLENVQVGCWHFVRECFQRFEVKLRVLQLSLDVLEVWEQLRVAELSVGLFLIDLIHFFILLDELHDLIRLSIVDLLSEGFFPSQVLFDY